MEKTLKELIEEHKVLLKREMLYGIIIPCIGLIFQVISAALLAAQGSGLAIVCCILMLLPIPRAVMEVAESMKIYRLGKDLLDLAKWVESKKCNDPQKAQRIREMMEEASGNK